MWQQEVDKAGIQAKVVGIEYYGLLAGIARKNFEHMFRREADIIVCDAAVQDFHEFQSPVIAYFYNPFDEVVLKKVLTSLKTVKSVIIYNNPCHQDVFVEMGFQLVSGSHGWHNLLHTQIYKI